MEEKKELTELDAYQAQIKTKLNARYSAIAKRLEAEPNIIFRYELKIALEELLQVYKMLFPEEE